MRNFLRIGGWFVVTAVALGVSLTLPLPVLGGEIKEVVLKPVNNNNANATDIHMSFTGIGDVSDVTKVMGPFTGDSAVTMIGGTTFISLEGKAGETVNMGKPGEFKFMLKGAKDLASKSVSWSDANGLLPTKNRMPGLTVKGDPIVTLTNQLDDDVSLGIRNLRFAINVTPIPLETLEFDAIPGLGSPQSDFVISNGSMSSPFDLGTLQPGKFDYIQGDVFNPATGLIENSFIFGIAVPAPLSLVLYTFGLLALLGGYRLSRARRTDDG